MDQGRAVRHVQNGRGMSRASPASRFVELLQRQRARPGVFNPWRDHDPRNDARRDAPEVRARQLEAYLAARRNSAKFLLVAEAVGYQGAKFSGVPLTSERILLGHLEGVPAECAFGGTGVQTSRDELHPRGLTEPTATIAWRQMLALGWRADQFVFWNAFPFHPHRKGQRLSNRKPTREELAVTAHVLQEMRDLFPRAMLIAVGGVAREALADEDLPHVRHPANGGATAFREQVAVVAGPCPRAG
jgi:hypothetical protein